MPGPGRTPNPQPSQTAPTAAQQRSRVEDGAYAAWGAAGLDRYTVTIRGGTHNEFIEVPYIMPGTSYGRAFADFYALAWMDRYVHPDPARRADAVRRLVQGPIPTADELASGTVEPWRANLMSARYAGAFSVTDVAAPTRKPRKARPPVRHEATDLRAHAGLSPVGDWAGANADRPAPRL